MSKFYKYIFLVLVIFSVSCYNDDSQTVESQDVAHRSSYLSTIIKSITLHNASFDDHIDNTSCFSLVFPYQLNVNSGVITISSAQDISALNQDDAIEIIYPVSVVFSNYEVHEIQSRIEFQFLKAQCEDNFSIQPNTCFDFDYPLVIKEFNQANGTFNSYEFVNDKDTYVYMNNLHESDVFELQYPINLLDSNSINLAVESNEVFEEIMESSGQECF